MSSPVFFFCHSRLSRQVLHLESSMTGITQRIDLIVEKLGLYERNKHVSVGRNIQRL